MLPPVCRAWTGHNGADEWGRPGRQPPALAMLALGGIRPGAHLRAHTAPTPAAAAAATRWWNTAGHKVGTASGRRKSD